MIRLQFAVSTDKQVVEKRIEQFFVYTMDMTS